MAHVHHVDDCIYKTSYFLDPILMSNLLANMNDTKAAATPAITRKGFRSPEKVVYL